MSNSASFATDLQDPRVFRDVFTPTGAAEAGLCPLAWYVYQIEHGLDAAGLYCIVEVLDSAGIPSVSIDMLRAYHAAEEAIREAREATEAFLVKIEALRAQRKRQQQFAAKQSSPAT